MILYHVRFNIIGLTQGLRIYVIATQGSNLKVLFSRDDCVIPFHVNSDTYKSCRDAKFRVSTGLHLYQGFCETV